MKRLLPLAALIFAATWSLADEAPKTDLKYPFRTNFANEHLPWYQPKPGEFPPQHSDNCVAGELVQADFIHRTGQFRVCATGELVDFTLPPFGSVLYLNTEADLRDVPLGLDFFFHLHQDANGRFTRVAAMHDRYTNEASHGFTYRLNELKLDEGKLIAAKQCLSKQQADLGKQELQVTDQTRVWKNEKQVKLSDLAVDDELLFNITGQTAKSPGRCTDLWVGADTHKFVTEQQRKQYAAFVKARGLPGWIDQTKGGQLTVTLFSGEPEAFQQLWMGNLKVGETISVVVANSELRTWNPPVDKERCKILEIGKAPVDRWGCSGIQLVVTAAHMLEGFRKGRIVRVFGGGWPIKDQFFGESLMNYGYGRLQTPELEELTPKEYPAQFPFRTDFGNEHLPWFSLNAGEAPPRFSDHLVFGELVKAEGRTGQFRTDRTGERVDFTLIPEGSVRYLNTQAALSDLPLGTRCRFQLYQDTQGAFTRASLIGDEFSYLALNSVTYRIEALNLNESKLYVARQIPPVKNYNNDMHQPPDIGRAALRINADTRVWKEDKQVKLADLAVGDVLLVNLSSEQNGRPSCCTDVWVGDATHKLAAEQQKKKHPTK